MREVKKFTHTRAKHVVIKIAGLLLSPRVYLLTAITDNRNTRSYKYLLEMVSGSRLKSYREKLFNPLSVCVCARFEVN